MSQTSAHRHFNPAAKGLNTILSNPDASTIKMRGQFLEELRDFNVFRQAQKSGIKPRICCILTRHRLVDALGVIEAAFRAVLFERTGKILVNDIRKDKRNEIILEREKDMAAEFKADKGQEQGVEEEDAGMPLEEVATCQEQSGPEQTGENALPAPQRLLARLCVTASLLHLVS